MAKSHIVQKGDTLGAIAKKFGTNVDNLTGFSSGNVNLIRPGETISVKSEANTEATDRASAFRSELDDSPAPDTTPSDSTTGGFDFSTLQSDFKTAQKDKQDAFDKLDGFKTNRYDELVKERKLDNVRDEISQLDTDIANKKNERDQSLAKLRSNPGASASTLSGRGKVASDLLNDEINNLVAQRNSKAGTYNTSLSEIEGVVTRESGDLETKLGFFTGQETSAKGLIDAYQKAVIAQLTREEDRGFDVSDSLTDFEQALEIARIRASGSGAGTNYTILTDQFGRPTVAIDKNDPTVQIDLSGTEGSTPKGGVDPALLQAQANASNNTEGGGIVDWFKGLFN